MKTVRYFVALAVFAAAVSAFALGAGDPVPSVPFPLGVADTAGKTACVEAAKGGIDAISLETGKTLWHSDAGTLPLCFRGGTLYCLTIGEQQVSVTALDEATGKKTFSSENIPLAEWVATGTSLGRTFAVDGSVGGDGKFDLYVHATAQYAGGVPPTPEMIAASKHDMLEWFEINLGTGKAESRPMKDLMKVSGLCLDPVTLDGVKYALSIPKGAEGKIGFVPRVVRATDSEGKMLWEHDVAPLYNPPIPP